MFRDVMHVLQMYYFLPPISSTNLSKILRQKYQLSTKNIDLVNSNRGIDSPTRSLPPTPTGDVYHRCQVVYTVADPEILEIVCECNLFNCMMPPGDDAL